jgi:hypothetical protein
MKKVILSLVAIFAIGLTSAQAQEKALIKDKKTGTILYNWKGHTCAEYNTWVNSLPAADAAYWKNDITCVDNNVRFYLDPCIVDYLNNNTVSTFADMQSLVRDQNNLSPVQLRAKYCTAAPMQQQQMKKKN